MPSTGRRRTGGSGEGPRTGEAGAADAAGRRRSGRPPAGDQQTDELGLPVADERAEGELPGVTEGQRTGKLDLSGGHQAAAPESLGQQPPQAGERRHGQRDEQQPPAVGDPRLAERGEQLPQAGERRLGEQQVQPGDLRLGQDGEQRLTVRPRRWWRGLTGAMAAGMAMLVLAEVVIQIYALFVDSAGPGLPSLIGHFITAAAVVMAQRYADRWTGPRAGACGVAVVVLTLGTLWFFWWA